MVRVLGIGKSFRNRWSVAFGLRREGVTSDELGFDRLFAVCKLGLQGPLIELCPQLGVRGGRVATQTICRAIEARLRTIVIFAFIHQPILPLSRVAFLAQ